MGKGMGPGHHAVVAACQQDGILPVNVKSNNSIDYAAIVSGSGLRIDSSSVFPIFDSKPVAPGIQ